MIGLASADDLGRSNAQTAVVPAIYLKPNPGVVTVRPVLLVKDGRPIECSDKEEFERRKALCESAMKHLPVEQKRRHYER
jgi:hypothetical protein